MVISTNKQRVQVRHGYGSFTAIGDVRKHLRHFTVKQSGGLIDEPKDEIIPHDLGNVSEIKSCLIFVSASL